MVNLDILKFSSVAVDNNIDNSPRNLQVFYNLVQLCEFLRSLEKMLDVDIIVNSGYRTPKINEMVGGSKTSYHLYGLAADITVINSPKCTLADLKELLKTLRHTRLAEVIEHDNYVHIAIKNYVK